MAFFQYSTTQMTRISPCLYMESMESIQKSWISVQNSLNPPPQYFSPLGFSLKYGNILFNKITVFAHETSSRDVCCVLEAKNHVFSTRSIFLKCPPTKTVWEPCSFIVFHRIIINGMWLKYLSIVMSIAQNTVRIFSISL